MTPTEQKLVLDALEFGRVAHRILEAPSYENATDEAISIVREEVERHEISDAEISRIWRDVVENGETLANNNFHLRFARALLEKAR